jgi:hypothetical protein
MTNENSVTRCLAGCLGLNSSCGSCDISSSTVILALELGMHWCCLESHFLTRSRLCPFIGNSNGLLGSKEEIMPSGGRTIGCLTDMLRALVYCDIEIGLLRGPCDVEPTARSRIARQVAALLLAGNVIDLARPPRGLHAGRSLVDTSGRSATATVSKRRSLQLHIPGVSHQR